MIKNDFAYYLEKQELLKTLQAFQTHFENLETTQNYQEGLVGFILSKLFFNPRVIGFVEDYKDNVINNFVDNLFLKGDLRLEKLQQEHERWVNDFEAKDIDPKIKEAVLQRVTENFNAYIERIVLKQPKNEKTTLSASADEADMVKLEKKVEKVPEPTPRITNQAKEIADSAIKKLSKFGKLIDKAGGTGELPANVDKIIKSYLTGQGLGTARQLIRELAAMSKDENIKKNPQLIRRIINILSGLILMTRRSATDDNKIAKFMRDARTKLRSLDTTVASTPTQTPK
jgi:hypothetical protein